MLSYGGAARLLIRSTISAALSTCTRTTCFWLCSSSSLGSVSCTCSARQTRSSGEGDWRSRRTC